MRIPYSSLIGGLALVVAGCAEIKVTKVTPENDTTVKGIRYALPKPFLQVSPRPDGTVAVDVIYLPDKSNIYAVDSWGWMSSSTFQVALDSGGLLSAIEFKQNTSAVGQQVATSAGAAAAQLYNFQAQQNVANLTAINTAQGTVDTTRTAADAAQAQLNSDNNVLATATANLAKVTADPNSTPDAVSAAQAAVNAAQANVSTDAGKLAQAQATYQDARQTLARVQATPQANSFSAAPGTAITPMVPTPGTTGFGPQTWSLPPGYNLPQNHGAVLFAIDEGVDDKGKPYVRLDPAEWSEKKAQEDFETTDNALGPPVLGPQNMKYSLATTNAVFFFNRPVESIFAWRVLTGTPATPVPGAQAPVLDDTKSKLTLPLSLTTPPGGMLKPADYQLSVIYVWGGGRQAPAATIPFTVSSP